VVQLEVKLVQLAVWAADCDFTFASSPKIKVLYQNSVFLLAM
jgi:hypothetical protein